jgi:cystathionine beta-synthase
MRALYGAPVTGAPATWRQYGRAMDVSGPQIAGSLLDLVGRTPMVRLGRIGRDLPCDLVAKVELFNPGGSVKDRPAVAMIDAAERDGLLVPGGTIVEPTSGNTGVGLAIVAAQRGYQCIFVMSDKMSAEKVALLRAYGADVVVCPTAVPPEHPDSYYSVADRLTRETPSSFRPDQYSNPHNPEEHERSTGPEIWEQTAGRVTHFVAGVGTGGTITGVARYLKRMNPDVQIVGADPEGSVYSGGTGRPYLVEGVGEDFWPTTYDPSLVDRTIMVTDTESFAAARRVTREEGLLIGGSCGTAVHAALVLGAELDPDAMIVVLLPDSGRGYLSKIYDDDWMMDFGFIRCDGPCAGDVLASKDGSIPELVLVTPEEPARRAWSLMRDLGVSQVVVSVSKEPPLAAKEVSGALDELSLMELAFRDPDVLDRPVEQVMSPAMPMIGIGEPVASVVASLEQAASLLVLDGGHPVGLVSRSDVLGFLAGRGELE